MKSRSIAGALALTALTVATVGGCAHQGRAQSEVRAMTVAHDWVERFQRGESFRGSPQPLITNGKPDAGALKVLAEALRTLRASVREEVSKTLIAIGRQVDPLQSRGLELLRDPDVIGILVTDGLLKRDAARDDILETLQRSTPGELLRPHAAELTENLERWPDSVLLLLVAKGKLQEASKVVEKLGKDPEWSREEPLLIAKAALGDREIEKQFIESFERTRDASEKARRAGTLGCIGTPAALKALAGGLRTDLIIEKPGVMRRSVRLDVLGALSYAYPDKEFLYDNAILDDAGYARAEQFAEQQFGIQWQTPRPPFLTIQGFPSDPSH